MKDRPNHPGIFGTIEDASEFVARDVPGHNQNHTLPGIEVSRFHGAPMANG